MTFIPISQLVEANGRTVRENNLDIPHRIPINALVSVRYSRWYGDGASERVDARLFVVEHNRDCDGTPLYGLSSKPTTYWEGWLGQVPSIFESGIKDIRRGFGEDRLTVVEVTDAVRRGEDALAWPEEG